MMTSRFSFELPESLIAQTPTEKRGASRLMVVHRGSNIEHRQFDDIVHYINSGDLLILNDTKVTPCRLIGVNDLGKEIDILLVEDLGDNRYSILTKGKNTYNVTFNDNLCAKIIKGKEAEFFCKGDFRETLWQIGNMPLPPYIKRRPDNSDKERYQTVYAKNEGSIAAPTAGIHFTDSIIKSLISKGVIIKSITLHVGIGTFRPIKVDDINDHKMLDEYFEINTDVIAEISETKKRKNKVILVGTTSTRTLEAYFSGQFKIIKETDEMISAKTDIFIKPGHKFIVPDCLLTNFHLPCSTPLLLVSAFAGIDTILKSYKEAIDVGYRFFSYGDAMILM
ncbi:MAG: tRNA preQ1(34) S-adenosylmethionine ribosyltransferase-isomerase QueA [Nitrospirae bacterium]|nr:tRNA preQ1(34) S-adenosylmethionine ribosyltransferase-isomerase QueA [Nitrospirota bacterium]